MSETIDLAKLVMPKLRRNKFPITVGDTVEHEFRFQKREADTLFEYVKEKEILKVENEEEETFVLRPLTGNGCNFPLRHYCSDGTFKLPKEYVCKYTKKIA